MKKLQQRGVKCPICIGNVLGVGIVVGVATVALCSLATIVWVVAS